MSPRASIIAPPLVMAAFALASGAQAQPLDARAMAEEQFALGRAAMDRGDHRAALESLRKSHELVPGRGKLLNIAICEAELGMLVAALSHLRELVPQLPPEDPRTPIAQQHLTQIDARVPRLRVRPAPGAPKDLHARLDDAPLAPSAFDTERLIDPGTHVILVSAPGFVDRRYEIPAAERARIVLDISTGAPRRPAPTGPITLSHRFQLGAFARADFTFQSGGGVVGVLGASFGVHDHLELTIAGLFGHSIGIEPGVTAFILKGAYKPTLSLSAPIFITDNAWLGIRPAAGVQWDPIRHFGLFAQAGVSCFPAAPSGYEKVVFTPSAGLQGRL